MLKGVSLGFVSSDDAGYGRAVAAIVIALVLVRLVLSPFVPLAYDEAYYWLWSKHLAGAYFDHPPMVAWLIRLGTMIGGDTQFGVRVIAILLALPATYAVWRSAVLLFGDAKLAATAALFFNLTLMVAGGTFVVTPDAPLLVASAFVLFFLAKVLTTGHGAWWLAVGLAAGAALLSKLSGLFLGVGILAWLALVPGERRWFRSPWLWLGGLVALAVFAPVLIWNANNEWATFLWQVRRVEPKPFTPDFIGGYLGSFIGLATPFIFLLGAMAIAVFLRGRGATPAVRHLLGAMVWPPVLYFAWHALHSIVDANWLAPTFPALAIAAAAAVHDIPWSGRWLSIAEWSRRLAVPVALAMIAAVYLQTVFAVIPLGRSDPTARQLGAGIRDLAAEIEALRQRVGARTVLTGNYPLTGWLAFYLPPGIPVIQAGERYRWRFAPEPARAVFDGPLLFVCESDGTDGRYVAGRYQVIEDIARLARSRRGVEIEHYTVYRLERAIGDPLDRMTLARRLELDRMRGADEDDVGRAACVPRPIR